MSNNFPLASGQKQPKQGVSVSDEAMNLSRIQAYDVRLESTSVIGSHSNQSQHSGTILQEQEQLDAVTPTSGLRNTEERISASVHETDVLKLSNISDVLLTESSVFGSTTINVTRSALDDLTFPKVIEVMDAEIKNVTDATPKDTLFRANFSSERTPEQENTSSIINYSPNHVILSEPKLQRPGAQKTQSRPEDKNTHIVSSEKLSVTFSLPSSTVETERSSWSKSSVESTSLKPQPDLNHWPTSLGIELVSEERIISINKETKNSKDKNEATRINKLLSKSQQKYGSSKPVYFSQTPPITAFSSLPSSEASLPPYTTSLPVTTIPLPMPDTSLPLPTTSLPLPTTSLPLPTTSLPLPTTSLPLRTTPVPLSTTSHSMPDTSLPLPTTSVPLPTTPVPLPTISLSVPDTSIPQQIAYFPLPTAPFSVPHTPSPQNVEPSTPTVSYSIDTTRQQATSTKEDTRRFTVVPTMTLSEIVSVTAGLDSSFETSRFTTELPFTAPANGKEVTSIRPSSSRSKGSVLKNNSSPSIPFENTAGTSPEDERDSATPFAPNVQLKTPENYYNFTVDLKRSSNGSRSNSNSLPIFPGDSLAMSSGTLVIMLCITLGVLFLLGISVFIFTYRRRRLKSKVYLSQTKDYSNAGGTNLLTSYSESFEKWDDENIDNYCNSGDFFTRPLPPAILPQELSGANGCYDNPSFVDSELHRSRKRGISDVEASKICLNFEGKIDVTLTMASNEDSITAQNVSAPKAPHRISQDDVSKSELPISSNIQEANASVSGSESVDILPNATYESQHSKL